MMAVEWEPPGELPSEVWIGKIRGMWPIYLFEDESQALYWLANPKSPNYIQYVWKVELHNPIEYVLVPPTKPSLKPKEY